MKLCVVVLLSHFHGHLADLYSKFFKEVISPKDGFDYIVN